MKTAPARLALPLLALLALPLGGCKLPYQILSKLVAPKPTPTPTPIPAQAIAAEFNSIEDERVAGDSQTPRMTVSVTLPGTKQNDVAAMRVVTKKVVDDLGTDLVLENAAAAALEPLKGENPEAPVVLPVPLKLAARKAVSVTEVSGEIELYVPGGDPSAAASNPRYLRRYRFALKGVPLP